MSATNKPDNKYQQPKQFQLPTIPYIPKYDVSPVLIDELFQAFSENNEQKIISLINEHNIQLDVRNTLGESLLHIVLLKDIDKYSEDNKLDVIKKYFDAKIMSNVHDIHGVTPLHIAAKYGYINIIDYLCRNNADVNVTDVNLMTPLHYAVIGYEFQCKTKNNVVIYDFHTFENGLSNFLIGTNYDDTIHLEPVLYKDDTIERKKYIGNYSLANDRCMSQINTEIIDILLKFGANLHARDKFNMTPLFYIIKNNDSELLNSLLSNKKYEYNKNHMLTPINIYGDSVLSYFKKMYKSHLSLFIPTKSFQYISSQFSNDLMKSSYDYVAKNSSHNVDNLHDIPHYLFILLNEHFRLQYTGTPFTPSLDNHMSFDHPKSEDVISSTLDDWYVLYELKYDSFSEYIKLWEKYLSNIDNENMFIFNIYRYLSKNLDTVEPTMIDQLLQIFKDLHFEKFTKLSNYSLEDINKIIIQLISYVIYLTIGKKIYIDMVRINTLVYTQSTHVISDAPTWNNIMSQNLRYHLRQKLDKIIKKCLGLYEQDDPLKIQSLSEIFEYDKVFNLFESDNEKLKIQYDREILHFYLPLLQKTIVNIKNILDRFIDYVIDGTNFLSIYKQIMNVLTM